MWWWWWNTQLGEVEELATQALGDPISVLADSGELDLETQGRENAYDPVVVGDAGRYNGSESNFQIKLSLRPLFLSLPPKNLLETISLQRRKLTCKSLIAESSLYVSENTG